ncbi:Transporter of the ATP-binding cassette (ABC) [Sorochytrium milnesiophthora]
MTVSPEALLFGTFYAAGPLVCLLLCGTAYAVASRKRTNDGYLPLGDHATQQQLEDEPRQRTSPVLAYVAKLLTLLTLVLSNVLACVWMYRASLHSGILDQLQLGSAVAAVLLWAGALLLAGYCDNTRSHAYALPVYAVALAGSLLALQIVKEEQQPDDGSTHSPLQDRSWQLGQLALICALTLAATVEFNMLLHREQLMQAERKPEAESSLLPSLEASASFWARWQYTWITPLLIKGARQPLEDEDVWDLVNDDKALHCWRRFRKHRLAGDGLKTALFRSIQDIAIMQLFCGFMHSILSFTGPAVLHAVVSFIEQRRDVQRRRDAHDPTAPELPPLWIAYSYILMYFVLNNIDNLFDARAVFCGTRAGFRVRAVLVSEIYFKVLSRSQVQKPAADGTATTLGKISNLHAVDAGRLHIWFAWIQYYIIAPVQVFIALASLYVLLGWSALVGTLVMVLLGPLQTLIGRRMIALQKKVMEATDRRLDRINEMLSGIRIIKFFAWEDKIRERVADVRATELQRRQRNFVLQALFSSVFNCGLIFVALISFACYTKLAQGELTAAKTFTALPLFKMLNSAITNLTARLTMFFEMRVSFQRITAFLVDQQDTDHYKQASLQDQLWAATSAFRYDADGRRRASLDVDTTICEQQQQQHPAEGSFTDCGPEQYTSLSGLMPVADLQDSSEQRSLRRRSENRHRATAIELKHATFTWQAAPSLTETRRQSTVSSVPQLEPAASGEASSEAFWLRDLSVQVPRGGLTLVVGLTASGKSSLLSALLGEMNHVSGEVYSPPASEALAFVPQQAWLSNNTIRNNILFGCPWDEDRYHTVIEACGLTRDLEILQGGDATEIGEKGINLSGGQKQRINLARAVYSKAPLVLLDDVLSALDAPTAKHVFDRAITGLLSDRTRVLVSHAVSLVAPRADHIVVLRAGTVAAQGSLAEVKEQLAASNEADLFEIAADDVDDEGIDQSADSSGSTQASSVDTKVDPDRLKQLASKRGTMLTTKESKKTGRLSFDVYKMYFRASGSWGFWVLLVVLTVSTKWLDVAIDYWLRLWASQYGAAAVPSPSQNDTVLPMLALSGRTLAAMSWYEGGVLDNVAHMSSAAPLRIATENHNKVDVDYYMGIYCLIGLVYAVALFLLACYRFLGSLIASRRLHDQLLRSILRCPVSFFDATPIGRIVNRFSKDMEAVDGSIMMNCVFLLSIVIGMLTQVTVIGAAVPKFLVVVPFLFALYYQIADFYLQSTREVKRLQSVNQSPMYSHFQETLDGVGTIRAYGVEQQFVLENWRKLDNSHRMLFMQIATNRWLSTRTGFADSLFLLSTGMAILWSLDNLDSGLVGFTLTYAMTFSSSIVDMLRTHSMLEITMNSAERIGEYLQLPEEAAAVVPGCRPPPNWPFLGDILVQDLSMRYREDLPLVLDHISFHVKAGERVAVVGRTGAGKSSLTLALFRFFEPNSGSIVIDGLDIAAMGLADLRGSLTIIPQDPVCFAGTIRSNLDIFSEYTDADLWSVLHRVQFTTSLADGAATTTTTPGNGDSSSVAQSTGAFTGTLDSEVSEQGSNLSVGQRQLLMIARALLRKSRVIVLDEATASIDSASDAKIQETLRTSPEFAQSTILCVAHRIKTIIDFDRVLVLDQGKVVEYDTPYSLLKQGEASQFWSMCQETGEYDLLYQKAKAKHQHHLQQ